MLLQFAPTQAVRDLIAKYDKEGPMGFEDAPGTWVKAKTEKGKERIGLPSDVDYGGVGSM